MQKAMMGSAAGVLGRPLQPLRRIWATHEQALVRAALVLGVFGAAVVLGRRPSLLFLAPFVGAIAVYIFARWPAWGVLLSIMGGMAVPYNGPSGLNVTMVGMALLIGIWVVDMVIVRKQVVVQPAGVLRAILILCGVAILAFLVGLLPWYSAAHAPLGAQLGGLALFILSTGTLFMVANQVKTVGGLQLITFGFIAYAALYVLGYLVNPIGQITNRLFFYGSLGSLFWTWLAILAFSQGLINRTLVPLVRLALLAVAAGTMYIAFVPQNDWKSGWIPGIVGIAVILALWSWRLGVVMAMAGTVPAAQLAQRSVSNDAYSYSTRVEAWQIMVEIIKANPVLGLGPANYYWYTPLFPIRGYFVSFNSHNQYVDLVAQVGLVGLAAYGWLLAVIAKVGWQLFRAPHQGDFTRAYVIGALAGLAATLVAGVLGDWVLPFFYNVGLAGFRASVLTWVFLGGLVALANMRTADGADSAN